jgi:hypothetical protein
MSGAMKAIAVTSAIGSRARAAKEQKVPTRLKRPRMI